MQEYPLIQPRIFARHPHITEADIHAAWRNIYCVALRADSENFPEYLWVGVDARGRDIEMIGALAEEGWLIYHANTPLSKRVRRELSRRKR